MHAFPLFHEKVLVLFLSQFNSPQSQLTFQMRLEIFFSKFTKYSKDIFGGIINTFLYCEIRSAAGISQNFNRCIFFHNSYNCVSQCRFYYATGSMEGSANFFGCIKSHYNHDVQLQSLNSVPECGSHYGLVRIFH